MASEKKKSGKRGRKTDEANKAEFVLLQTKEVRLKKLEGFLNILNERLTWVPENRNASVVQIRYSDIKMQKISQDGRSKVQLQLCLHDGNSYTFHFVNQKGSQAQLDDRNKVKSLLAQLFPNFQRRISKELEEKARILSHNPRLNLLYKELVLTQVLTCDDFWDRHVKPIVISKLKSRQDVGVNGGFFADIRPQVGLTGLKYNLTAELMQCIFKTYPVVFEKFKEIVPSDISEQDFWTKFFQSHYFHRDRITAGTNDLFADCSRIDDTNLKIAVDSMPSNCHLNLTRLYDLDLEDGFCTINGLTKDPYFSENMVHQNMIRRFNFHSLMVLNASLNPKKLDPPLSKPSESTSDELSEDLEIVPTQITESNICRGLWKKIYYEDLGELQIGENIDFKDSNPLKFARRELYNSRPEGGATKFEDSDLLNLRTVQSKVFNITESWTNPEVIFDGGDPQEAMKILNELSPSDNLMKNFKYTSSSNFSKEYEQELRELYVSLSELLKHFWCNFPLTTPERRNKFTEMYETIQRFKSSNLAAFEEKTKYDLQHAGKQATAHMHRMIEKVEEKFKFSMKGEAVSRAIQTLTESRW